MRTCSHGRNVIVLVLVLMKTSEAALKEPAWKHCMHPAHALPGKWDSIKSPGFPKGINTQIQCSWIIQANPGYKVKLAFHTLNMTGSHGSCFTQFVEILDYKVGHSMGKFCGTSRPGDYVSYGFKVRFDLQGDTSGAKTKGFDLRYKAVRETGGFKSSWAFSNRAVKKKKKPSTKSKPRNTKRRKPTGPAKVFGGSSRNPNNADGGPSTSGTGERSPVSQNPGKSSRAPIPNRVEFRPPSNRPSGPVIYGANSNARAVDFGRSNVIQRAPDNSETTIDYTIIAGIAAGGAVLLVTMIVIIKLCVCDRAKRRKFEKANTKNLGKNSEQTPGFAMNPIPGMIPERHFGEEEIVQRHPSSNRLNSWSGIPPTISYSQYPVIIEQPKRRSVATMSRAGRKSSRSRTSSGHYKPPLASLKSGTSRKSDSRTRSSEQTTTRATHARSRSLSYLPSQMNGWVRVDDPHSATKRKRHPYSESESSDATYDSNSCTDSDSSYDYRSSKRSHRAGNGRSLKRNTLPASKTLQHQPYFVIDKPIEYDEGYDTARRVAFTATGRSHPGKGRKQRGKRSRKYSY